MDKAAEQEENEGKGSMIRDTQQTALSCRFRSGQNGSREQKPVGTLGVHHLVFVFHISVCSGNYISGSDDHSFQSSVKQS